MRKRLKNLKNKSGHSDNGSPRQMIDEALYRERQSGRTFDSQYAGWSWASRPKDSPIFLRSRVGSRGPSGATGITGATGSTGSGPSQFVDLRTAGNFALYGGTGITNVPGGSSISGDIGASEAVTSTAITGFALVPDGGTPSSTSIRVHAGAPVGYPAQLGLVFAHNYTAPTPTNIVQATADMITAYNDAAGRTPVGGIFVSGDISGLTLEGGTNGVYRFTGATSVVSADLTLHGTLPGDAIIIQIQGTFAVHQNIVLTGTLAGHPENVYFAVTGAVTVFPGVVVNGEFLGQTGITLQTGAALNGRALAQSLVALDNNTVVEV